MVNILINSLLNILIFKYLNINSLLILAINKCLQVNYITADNNLTDNILLNSDLAITLQAKYNNILFNSDLAVALQNIYPGVNSLPALTILALTAH